MGTTTAGSAKSSSRLVWLQSVLEKINEIKSQRIGEGIDAKGVKKLNEGQVLNRVIRHTRDGYELEADHRHAELIIQQLELQSAKAVVTPGVEIDVECQAWNEEPEEDELPVSECTHYRAIAARRNYFQPDRPDIQYAVNECCRMMSRPTAR